MIYMRKSHFIVDIFTDIFVWKKIVNVFHYISQFTLLLLSTHDDILFITRSLCATFINYSHKYICVGECRINIYSRYFIIDVTEFRLSVQQLNGSMAFYTGLQIKEYHCDEVINVASDARALQKAPRDDLYLSSFRAGFYR